ncbi:putative L-ascorbate oxidase [Medicago truncatula]|uniref:Multi-copper oxidase-like protein n=1 Tax=Medicago truncatula TaxID=3880 RepID=A0A072TSL7_MEDTR|nr:L-ascorbate oxidase homolog [Medicago truncatula]KEH20499.1 multi-copper oxidase-like protein [Medicago truncatula]RHN42197.1 putative L-ascorbate oxidase [Medicago truncatula]
MNQAIITPIFFGILACWSAISVTAEDRYQFFTWEITKGTIFPLGVPQEGILINGQFPGPTIEAITNDNIVVNVINKLDDKFLITWSGIKQRRTSWQDGVLGTNCPIPPNSNWTYKFQVKDQVGTYTYFPSTKIHKAAGGFGGFNIAQRSTIAIPYPAPDGEFTLLVGDWSKTNHKVLRRLLDVGKSLPFPDALLINGVKDNAVFTGEAGKTYKFRVSNVGMATSINFRIQGHSLKLIEVEGAHTLQETYESLDVHVGQSMTVLVTLDKSIGDYYIVASTRFTNPILTTTATLRYSGSNSKASGLLPVGPTDVEWSIKQARTIRLNLTANAARPNPQGSFHYGTIPVLRVLQLANSKSIVNGKLRYAVNGISHINPSTPLKLADWFNIPGIFDLNTIKDFPSSSKSVKLGTSVLGFTLHDFAEIIFQNDENTIQSWHMDGSSFYVVGFGKGKWTPDVRRTYNLVDGITRYTTQVYPNSWTTILVSLDNKGMWNLRSAIWENRYLGQDLYMRVWNNEQSLYTETNVPLNALFCGKAKHLPKL